MSVAGPSGLTVYTTSWCGYCLRLKNALTAEGISFAEVDIEADPAAAEFVASANDGNQTVPTVRFADGSTLTNPRGAEVKAKLAGLQSRISPLSACRAGERATVDRPCSSWPLPGISVTRTASAS